MATITFANNTPVAGLAFNPGLEDVLDPTGTNTTSAANLYEITNTSGGPFNGFKFQLTSSVNGTGNFTYVYVAGGATILSGTIDGITVRAPDGTIIVQVAAGGPGFGFGDQNLANFVNRFTDVDPAKPLKSVFTALDQLLYASNIIEGSGIADHATAFGSGGGQVLGGGGDDVLTSLSYGTRELIGTGGNDLFRIEQGLLKIHGGGADGSALSGETNTLEIVGYVDATGTPNIEKFTNINVLKFVAGNEPAPPALEGANVDVSFNLTKVGADRLSVPLAVDGSTTASPLSRNVIYIGAEQDNLATTGFSLDLSGWTFTNWSPERNFIYINTNPAARVLNDSITGTPVADEINTYYGDDTLRGGGGADNLNAGPGDDVFVYGAGEAVSGERISGGTNDAAGGLADAVLVVGDNNFAGVTFRAIEQLRFGGPATAVFDQSFIGTTGTTVVGNADANALVFQLTSPTAGSPGINLVGLTFQSWTPGADTVTILGTKAGDAISGSTQNDIINGGGGADDLQGNKGADFFVFDTGFGKGLDHVVDFSRKEGDEILLDNAIYKKLKLGALAKSAFTSGDEAHDKNDRIIYDTQEGVIRYDDDGIGKHKAHIIAILDDAPNLKAADFFVI